MATMATFFHFLHVAAALWITAGVFGSSVVRVAIKRSAGTLEERALGFRILWRLHVVYTLPGLLLAGFLGFYLVTAAGYRFGAFWVMASSMLYLAMFLWTVFLLTPALHRLHGAARSALEAGETTAELDLLAGSKLWGILSDVNALSILVLVFFMTVKP
jgi:uncharacterized membrane protein